MDSTTIPKDHYLPNFKKSDTLTEDALRVPPPSPADPPPPEAIFKREVGLAQLQLGRLKRHLQKVSTDGRLQTRQRMLERAIREQSGMISELMARMPQNRQPTKKGATRYISGDPSSESYIFAHHNRKSTAINRRRHSENPRCSASGVVLIHRGIGDVA